MYRFEETLPEEVLVKMQAVPRPDFPVITPALLVELDAMILCFPTRFDRPPAEVATFFDKVRADSLVPAVQSHGGSLSNDQLLSRS